MAFGREEFHNVRKMVKYMRYRYSKRCDTTQFANYYFGDMDYMGRYYHSVQDNRTNRTSPFFDHSFINYPTLYAYDRDDISEYRLDANTYVFKGINHDFI